MAAAETAAGMTVGVILHPERAARLVDYHSRDPGLPGLGDVIDRLFEATWMTVHEDGYHQELQRVVNNIVLYFVVGLVKNSEAPAVVRSLAYLKLLQLNERVCEIETEDEAQLSQYLYLDAILKQLEENPAAVSLTPPAEPPMGPPI
jgi:hypothetical protein